MAPKVTKIRYSVNHLFDKEEYHTFKTCCDRVRLNTSQALMTVKTEGDIEYFTIHKTYVKCRKVICFDYTDKETWHIHAIHEKKKTSKFDFIYVIGVFPSDMLKSENVRKTMCNVQTLAIAVRNDLINYFTYEQPDPLLHSDSFQPGPYSKSKNVKGGIVYIGIKMKRYEKV